MKTKVYGVYPCPKMYLQFCMSMYAYIICCAPICTLYHHCRWMYLDIILCKNFGSSYNIGIRWKDPIWWATKKEEMFRLEQNETCTWYVFRLGSRYQQVYAVKLNLDGSHIHLKWSFGILCILIYMELTSRILFFTKY